MQNPKMKVHAPSVQLTKSCYYRRQGKGVTTGGRGRGLDLAIIR